MKFLNDVQGAGQTVPCQNTTDAPVVLRAEGLHFSYGEQVVLNNFSARVVPGVTLVTGDSGCGKTTLIRLLAGKLVPSAGQLYVNGIKLQDDPQAYHRLVCWTEPYTDAFDQLTALDYFQLQRQTHGGLTQARVAFVVAGLGLQPHLDKPLYKLSTGSRRKVWLTAAFASRAAVTLLDEPFAALDMASIQFVRGLLEHAATHPGRAWVLAHYEALANVPLAATIDLGA